MKVNAIIFIWIASCIALIILLMIPPSPINGALILDKEYSKQFFNSPTGGSGYTHHYKLFVKDENSDNEYDELYLSEEEFNNCEIGQLINRDSQGSYCYNNPQ